MAPPTKATFEELKQQLSDALVLVAGLTAQVDALAKKVAVLEDRVAMAVNQARGQRYAS